MWAIGIMKIGNIYGNYGICFRINCMYTVFILVWKSHFYDRHTVFFWLKLHPFFWETDFFPSTYWYVGGSGQVQKTGEFWLKKAGDGPLYLPTL